MLIFFSCNGEFFFGLTVSSSGNRADALILGVGGSTGGSGPEGTYYWFFVQREINGFGGGVLFIVVVHFVDMVFLSFQTGFFLSYVVLSVINGSFLVIMGSTRVFLLILLPGVKTVRATGAIDVLRSFGCRVLLL